MASTSTPLFESTSMNPNSTYKNIVQNNSVYCDLKNFHNSYAAIHGHLSLIVCVFGSIANILNVCVLTTKNMRLPTNLILTGLAVADLLVMLEYIPFASYNMFDKTKHSPSHYSYDWALFLIWHAHLTQTFHFVACCLTVMLAVWRYLAITYPQKSKIWCSNERTLNFIIATPFLCILVIAPCYATLSPQKFVKDGKTSRPYNETIDIYNNLTEIYYVRQREGMLTTVSFWVYSVILKLLPCILLTGLSERLIRALFKAKERRKLLLNKKKVTTDNGKVHKSSDESQADRTTRMLLAVLLLFLMTEFPQAILGLVSGIYGEKFVLQCYYMLGKFI